MPGKQKSRKQNWSVPERCAFCFLLSVECMESREAESRMGQCRNAVLSAFCFLLSGECLQNRKADSTIGHCRNVVLSAFCFLWPAWKAEKQKAAQISAGMLCFLLSAFWGMPGKQKQKAQLDQCRDVVLSVFCFLGNAWKAEKQKAKWISAGTLCFLLSAFCGLHGTQKSRKRNESVPGRCAFCFLLSAFWGMPGKQKSRQQNGSVPERCAFCFLLSAACMESRIAESTIGQCRNVLLYASYASSEHPASTEKSRKQTYPRVFHVLSAF
eukprot:gene25059-biopygen4467